MSEKNDLAPWVHPKSKAWFKVLFRRTNLTMALQDELNRPIEQLDIHIVRMALAMAVMFGKPEIWPEEDRQILKLIVNKAREFARTPPQSVTGKPVSVAEHQAHSKLVKELTAEVELVRRRLGISVLKTKASIPPSWQRFWE